MAAKVWGEERAWAVNAAASYGGREMAEEPVLRRMVLKIFYSFDTGEFAPGTFYHTGVTTGLMWIGVDSPSRGFACKVFD